MPIEEILDQLDELIDRSWSLPLTGGRCVVDADKVRELLDDVRLNLPTEISQAQSIVADRTAIVEEAKKEAEAIIARAEKRAAALVEEQEIVRQSKNKAAELPSRHSSRAAKCASLQKISLTEFSKIPRKPLQLPLPKLKEPALLLTSSRKPHRQTHSLHRNKTKDKTGALLPFFYYPPVSTNAFKTDKNSKIFP